MVKPKFPTPSQAQYITGLFRQGRTITEVQSVTGNQWPVTVLDNLRLLALRGEAA